MHTLKFLGLQPTCVIKILHKIVSLNWRKTHCHYIGWLTITLIDFCDCISLHLKILSPVAYHLGIFRCKYLLHHEL